MTWYTFNTPDHTPVPVNMARVSYIERTRSPNDQTKWSGRLRLYFAKEFYLEVLQDEAALENIGANMMGIQNPK